MYQKFDKVDLSRLMRKITTSFNLINFVAQFSPYTLSLEKLKLSKSLQLAMSNAGYLTGTDIQQKVMSRIVGGQNVLAIAPDGAGKTTCSVLGALMRLKYTPDEAPKVLILVPDREKVAAMVEEFTKFSHNRDLRIIALVGTGGTEEEINDLMEGAEIVVATPPRARAIYLKLGLNLNKLQMFVVDDAEQMIKAGMQLPIAELARSAGKCQYVAFTTVMHSKLRNLLNQFMEFAPEIEVEVLPDQQVQTYPLSLYHVPDFQTKIHLLKWILRNDDSFTKGIVFVNTRLTAQKLGKELAAGGHIDVGVLHPLFFDEDGFDEVADFTEDERFRLLIVANEITEELDLSGITKLIHFDVPEKNEQFLQRVVKEENAEKKVVTFATDMELVEVKKIEQSLGFRMSILELPAEIPVIKKAKSKSAKYEPEEELIDEISFHKKKASNSKTFNYGIGQKAIMNKKRKHG